MRLALRDRISAFRSAPMLFKWAESTKRIVKSQTDLIDLQGDTIKRQAQAIVDLKAIPEAPAKVARGVVVTRPVVDFADDGTMRATTALDEYPDGDTFVVSHEGVGDKFLVIIDAQGNRIALYKDAFWTRVENGNASDIKEQKES